ncbi:hypothetical protein SAMN05444166_5692 [Singulisphaera sp. GP187]|uniref:hypothetical protein n=1 Tax=Singulisphaera sp. GP187 TaxID=1882752 RepID=UPI00092B93D4|nr:hypothetical protein [Singulisphaera sp. GP187]SIO58473.1 hypothetical protein SAMN05444166_5692 [Singulisphaera sp. GP187]
MDLIVDTPYEFPGFLPQPALCRLRIFTAGLDRPPIVIASDSPLYRGASITMYVENLAAIVCRDFQIAPDAMIWIEHYRKWRSYGETFRFVEFQVKPRNGEPWKPAWHFTDRPTVERLVGGPLTD